MDKRATTEESLLLPEDILEEILVRLPLKLLRRFRCVSKSWLSLIDSKGFIRNHIQHWAHHRVLITFTDSDSTPKQYNYRQCSQRALLEGPAATDLSPLCHPISTNPRYNLCCCNGVLCFYEGGRFLLLNPTTGVSKELTKDPEIDNRDFLKVKIGLGWDESCCAYKVFAGWRRMKRDPPWTWTWQYKSRVYSSKTNSWKTVEDPYLPTSSLHVGKFVGGKLHWMSRVKKSVTISSFDVKTEEFGTIELPGQIETVGEFYPLLGVVGDCLCFSVWYYRKAFHVWVMKESWEKLPIFHLHNPNFYAEVIGEAANGGILIYHASSLFVYCPRNGVILHRTEIGRIHTAHLYVESLVSPFLH